MKTLYWATRLTGYAAGGIGMILFVLGRQSETPRGALFVTGATLLILSFAAFFVSYLLYIFKRLSRP
ncbi:MAG: hypothetical protein KJ726_03535 [Verrucomicrobia bacterium]|nr:hypothetical protein [Verrucomicrobiota bacterium]MBU1909098.1 hypothetical protein [Verrucomicrobiota bacterium]